jgi:ABC-2 type transport system permease protein
MCLLILLILSVMHHGLSNAILMIPGLISLPVFAMAANIGGAAVPLSRPTEEAKSASRGLTVMLAMFCSGLLAALTIFASSEGWFWWLVGIESIVVIALYLLIRRAVTTAAWQPID